MRQVVQSYKTGEVTLRNVAVPLCSSKRVLVKNDFSLISIGTERSTIELGKKSLAGKEPLIWFVGFGIKPKEGLSKPGRKPWGVSTPYSSGL